MSKEAAKILRKAKKLLVEKGWTKGWFARNKRGESCSYSGRTATTFCAVGAVNRAGNSEPTCDEAIHCLEWVIDGGVPRWNDDPRRTKRQVLAAFDKAIKLAEGEK